MLSDSAGCPGKMFRRLTPAGMRNLTLFLTAKKDYTIFPRIFVKWKISERKCPRAVETTA
jgi:hypothetical protein